MRSTRKSKSVKKKKGTRRKEKEKAEESKVVDEEAVYWQKRKGHYQDELSALCSNGLPAISVDSPKTQPTTLLQKVAVHLEGASAGKSVYALAKECSARLDDPVDIDEVVDLISGCSTVRKYLDNPPPSYEFSQDEVLPIVFKEYERYNKHNLVSCGFQVRELNSLSDLACWADLEDFQLVRRLREHIAKCIHLLRSVVDEIDNQNYSRVEELHRALVQLKADKMPVSDAVKVAIKSEQKLTRYFEVRRKPEDKGEQKQ